MKLSENKIPILWRDTFTQESRRENQIELSLECNLIYNENKKNSKILF